MPIRLCLLAVLSLIWPWAKAADVPLPPTVSGTVTYGPANTTTSATVGTVLASTAVVTVKTGRLLLNNFKVASGASFKCQLVPYFPAAPTASPSPVTAKTTTLYVTPVQWYLGENTVTYSWAKTSGPGTATFVAGAAMPDLRKTWTATFSLSGTYVLTVTATGAEGSANTYPVTMTVNATATDVVVTPATATPVRGGLVAFTGTARDQFAAALSTQPAISWTTAGGGTFLPKGNYVLEASGTDIWGTNDGFQFVHQQLTGDGTITAKVESLENTNAWAKAGVMMRDGLTDNAINAMANVTAAAGALFQRRTTVGGTSTNVITAGQAAPYWVRLTRVGNTLTGYSSPDGTTWTQLGTDTVTMAATVRVGLAVTSHQSGVRAQARFSNVSITPATATAGALPSGWTQQDINITTPVGSGTYTPSTGTYTVQASGTDIWGTSDQFRFMHRPLPAGDVTLIARVTSLTNTDAWAKAGLMIRDGLAADARNAMVNVTAASGALFQRRTTTAGTSVNTILTGHAAPRWIKLVRSGSLFSGYVSTDGATWTFIGSETVTMGASVYMGLAVTSHNATTLTTAAFDNVQILIGTTALATMQWPWQTQDVGTVVLAGSAYTTTAPGVFLASQTLGGPYTVTATGTGVPTAGTAQVTITNGTPIISIAAKSSASPVTGTTTTLTAYGDDDAGEPGLIYTWATTGTPPASVAFSANNTNAAKSVTATFTRAGTYVLRATAKDANNATSAPSDVTVIVNQTITTVAVTPTPVSVATGGTQQFTAVANDQFGQAMVSQPTFGPWVAPAASGTITSGGLFTASATAGGPHNVTVQGGGKTGTAVVSVVGPPSINIAATDATATEGGDTATFTLTRSGIASSAVTVNFTVTGSATGSDYTALGTSVVIPAGATTKTLTVTTLQDTLTEPNKTVIVTLATGTGYTVGSPANATATIIDDEQGVSIAATDAAASETGPDTGTFTITRTGTTAAALTVNVTLGGTAVSGDYASVTVPVVIAAGSATATRTVTPVDDTLGEPSETVIMTLTTGSYTIGSPSAATVTIADNDAVVTIAATDANATESATPDTGTFTFTRTGATTAALTVTFAVSGTASAGDFTSLGTSVVIPAGSVNKTLTLTPTNDALNEPNETVIVTVVTAAGYTAGSPSAATVTIVDDEQTVTIAATDANAAESATPDTGTWTVTRTGVTTAALTVNLAVSGTASASDFTSLGTTVVIPAGAASKTITLTPVNDALNEPNETVIVTLTTGTGYYLGGTIAGTVTIVDDEQTVSVAATDAAASETGPDNGTFTFTRTGITTNPLTVVFTLGGTAVVSDYGAITTSVTISAGAASATVTATPVNDTAYEGSETVIATITANAAYFIGTASATVTIADNDLPTITIAATDANAAEPSNTGTFTLTRSGFNGVALMVTVTPGGSAGAGADYTALPATATFATGQSTTTVPVTPINDTLLEASKTVTLTIATGSGYTVGSPNAATVTILDDEQGISIAATDAIASEPGSPDTGLFTIIRTAGVTSPALTINLTTTSTATVGSDFTALPATVNLAAGQMSTTVTLTAVDNTLSEPDETVTLTVASGTGYVVGTPAAATVSIKDNDAPLIAFQAASSSVGESGTQIDIPVVLSFPYSLTTTVNYALTGTATGNGDDYYLPNGTLIFAPGETSKILSLQVRDDATVEANETAIITLSAPVNGALDTIKVHTVTITDNDAITVQVAATDPVVTEDGTHYGAVTFTRTGSLAAALTANLSLTGSTATVDTDYADPTDTGTKITFPIGVASVTRAVVAKQDSLHEVDETIVVTVIAGTGYTVGTPSVATLTIRDDDVVTIAATTPNATEAATPTNGVFTLTRVSTTNALTVSVAITGTATAGGDYTRNPTGTTVTFNAGVATATLTITPVQDALVEGPETVIATIIPTTPTATYTIGAAASATVTITDDEVLTLTISATDATAVEPGGDNATFTITRPAATTAALTVTYQVSGTATPGLDYTALSGTATIAANATSTTVTLTALGDQITEADETVVLTLIGVPTYNIGATPSATATIKDCTLTIAATDAEVKEPNTANQGKIRISRNNTSTSALAIPVQWSGNAVLNTDFTATPAVITTATIPANATFVDISVAAKADALVEGTETAILLLQASTTVPFAISGSWSASTSIEDATLTITASRTEVTENANEQVTLTVTRTGDFSGPALNVAFALSGATLDVDYSSSVPSGTLTIPTGNASAPPVSITTNRDDTTVEGDETITATIGPSSYGIITSSVAIILHDDDFPIVDLAVSDAAVSETGPDTGTFMLTRSGSTANPLTVTLTRAGTATALTDYTATPTSITGTGTITVTILAGQESAPINITPVNDSGAEVAETVILTLVPQATYRVGQAQAQISISDNEPPVVSIAATAAQAVEGGALGVLTLQRTGDPTTTISIGISTTGSTATAGSDYSTLTGPIVLGPNVTTKDLYISPTDDDLPEVNETVKVTLVAGAGYSLGATTNATVTIADNDLPTVTVVALQPNAAEGATPVTGTVRFTRTGDTTTTLSVPFLRTGTASTTLGTDYTLNPNVSAITFAANEVTADLVITPVNNATANGDKTVIVTLVTGAFTPGIDSSATVTIGDDERPTVRISATDNVATEAGLTTATFTVTRSAPSTTTLTVPYTVGGSATPGIDYLSLTGLVTILANQTSSLITITPRDDGEIETAESIDVTLGTSSNFNLGSDGAVAAITLYSDELPAAAVTYQYGKGLVVEASGIVPYGHDITAVLATTTTPGLILVSTLTNGGFAIRASLAAAGTTTASIILQYQDARGVLGPKKIAVLRWPTGSETTEQGSPDGTPLAPPVLSIAYLDSSLTGDKHGEIKGENFSFTNTGGNPSTPVLITASAQSYGGGVVSEIIVSSSDGQEYRIPGSSGTASFKFASEGIFEFVAYANASRAQENAMQTIRLSERLVVDRSPPKLEILADKSLWDSPTEPLVISNGPLKTSAYQREKFIFLNSNPELGFTGNGNLRKYRQRLCFNAQDFSVTIKAPDEVTGLKNSSSFKVFDKNNAPLLKSNIVDEGGEFIGWKLNGFHTPFSLNTRSYTSFYAVNISDRCGNYLEDTYQPYPVPPEKVKDLFYVDAMLVDPSVEAATESVYSYTSPVYWLSWPSDLSMGWYPEEAWQGVPSKPTSGQMGQSFTLNNPVNITGAEKDQIAKTDTYYFRDWIGNIVKKKYEFRGLQPQDYVGYGNFSRLPTFTDPASGAHGTTTFKQAGYNSLTGTSVIQTFSLSEPGGFFDIRQRYDYGYNDSHQVTSITVNPATFDPLLGVAKAFKTQVTFAGNGIDVASMLYGGVIQNYPYSPGSGTDRYYRPAVLNYEPAFKKGMKRQEIQFNFPSLSQVRDPSALPVLRVDRGRNANHPVTRNGDALSASVDLAPIGSYINDYEIWRVGNDYATVGLGPYQYGTDTDTFLGFSVGQSMPVFNFINLSPNIAASGMTAAFTIRGNFLSKEFGFDDFNRMSADYIRFIKINGSSEKDVTQAISVAPGVKPGSDKVTIVSQRLRDEQDQNSNMRTYQVLEFTVFIGADVAAGLYSVDVKVGAVHAYPDELSRQFAGANGAHRMKEALAIVKINYETELDQNPPQITKTMSVPNISVSPSVTVSGVNATVSLSGTVTDAVANLLEAPAMKSVHVYHHNKWVGDIALSTVSGSPTDWKPYSKSFAFSGSVTIPAWEGEHLMNVVTDANESGIQGSANFSATMNGTYPNPVIRETVAIQLNGDLRATQTDAITLVIPNQYIGQNPATVTLTETAVGSNVFQDVGAVYRVSISEGGQTNAILVDTISATVEKNGEWYCEEVFTENGPSSLRFEALIVRSNAITAPTVMTYKVDLSGVLSPTVVNQIAITLPNHIAGPSPTPIALTETGADTKVFTATVGSTVIQVDLLGATTGVSIPASVKMSESKAVTANFIQIGGVTSTQYQYSTTITSDAPSFSLRSVSSAISPAQQETVTPYRVSIQAPSIIDTVITSHKWFQNGSRVDLIKKDDRYYVKDATTGNAMVFVDPAWAPVNGTVGTEGGEGEDEGPVTFSGTNDTIHLSVTIGIARSRLPTPVPDTYTVTVVVSPDAAQRISASVIGLNEEDTWTTQEVRGFDKTVQGSYQVTLKRQGAIQVAGNVTSDSLTPAEVKLARTNPKTFLDNKLMAWYLVQGENAETTGWVWNALDNPVLDDDIPLWTIPELLGAPEGNALSLASSVIAALTKDVVIPGVDLGVERIVQNAFIAHVGFGGTIRTWDLPEARAVYLWVAPHATYKSGDTDIPVGKKAGDLRYEKEGTFDLPAAIDAYNKANGNIHAAAEARREERMKIAREIGWELRPINEQTAMNGANQVLSAMNQLADVTAWAGYIGGGKRIVLPEGDATWAAVGVNGGFLLVNFVPFAKVGSVVGKSGKVLFKKVEESALPKARQAVRDFLPTETLVRASTKLICFVAGTRVKVSNGFKAIEDIRVGDMVWSRDERSGAEGLKHVEQTFMTTPATLIHLRYHRLDVGNMDGDASELVGTTTHPFWVKQLSAWVPMGELKPGYQLHMAGNECAVVESVRCEEAPIGQCFTTYNFSVADWQTYFVASSNSKEDSPSIWVHNVGGFCDKAWGRALAVLGRMGETRFFQTFTKLPKWQVSVMKAQLNRRQLSSLERDAVREAARRLWAERAGTKLLGGKGLKEAGYEVHHRIELQFSHLFPDNPNAIENVFTVKIEVHAKITKAWEEWLRLKGGVGNVTKAEVEAQAALIDGQFAQDAATFIAFP